MYLQLCGKTITLDVEKEETISAVKSKVQAKQGFSTTCLQNIKIIFNGKQIDEDRTVADYSIEKESVLHIRLNLRSQEKCMDEPSPRSAEKSVALGIKRRRDPEKFNRSLLEDGDSQDSGGCSQDNTQAQMQISVESVSIFLLRCILCLRYQVYFFLSDI